jgi:glutaminase
MHAPAPPTRLPLYGFLERCHAEIAADSSGAVADYIPELTKADPKHFGISLATTDGYVYEIGDSAVAFTIQSVSKAFVFALALEMLGAEQVEAVIGVEPSGEAFNSIRLRPDNRPFNPMVNAGAIACSGLIREAEGDRAFEKILDALGRFAGRKLSVDEAVYASEHATGHRNRAIAYLLRNHSVIKGDVDEALEVYFRQCSILVTARDLSIMAATLSNHGVNPVTGEKVISSYSVARTLSVMTSSGMYDYAGEWVYRVGIPAKSGVGGGIMAALPAQFGLGTYSPLLDSHGNSVRGLKTCEALSSHFDLHVLNRTGDVRTCVIAEYGIGRISSRRTRQAHEQKILSEQQDKVRVLELVGALNYETVEYLSRRLSKIVPQTQFVILDFRRVPTITRAAAQFLAESLGIFSVADVTAVLSGIEPSSLIAATVDPHIEKIPKVRKFGLLDEAIEWTEDQIVFRHGGFLHLGEAIALGEQALLAGLPPEEMQVLTGFMQRRTFQSGERFIKAGETANSFYFIESGMVSVKLPSGVRVATLSAGMVVGEMALIDKHRSADVWADTQVQCRELPIDAYEKFRDQHPQIAERLARNLAGLLAKRLVQANSKIELLTSH